MSEEEYMECSVVAYPRQIKFLHINGGAISYYVDRHVSDYVDRLQKENQELKKQLHEASIEMQEMIEQDIECPSNCSKLKDLDKIEKSFIEIKNQQKEFIEYMNKTIEELECDDTDDEEMKGYLIQRIDTFKEILSKYKSIIGDTDDNK